jgi:5-amino-6-(5-phosphoribosylamino)uracil reductase
MLEQNLVDEIFWTLCPVVLGGREAAGSFTGRGFRADEVCRLELLEQRTNAEGEIFLHYRVRR